jgi:hypothetical protein
LRPLLDAVSARLHGTLARIVQRGLPPLAAADEEYLTERDDRAVSSAGGATVEVREMAGRIGQWWRLGRGRGVRAVSSVSATVETTAGFRQDHADADAARDEQGTLPLSGSSLLQPASPEQPVLLNTGNNRPVHVGELLPSRRGPWPLALVRLPAVPKRAILAAGVCAGLAGPALARHFVSRALFGRPAAVAGGAIEITRIIYNGPLTPQAAAAIGKALIAARR